jgi:hypothetical protein
MPILINDPNSRIALQVGLAICAHEQAVFEKELLERNMGDALERAYKYILNTGTKDEFEKICPNFCRWLEISNPES